MKQFFKIAFSELPNLEKGAKQEPIESAEPVVNSDIYNEMNGLPRYDKNVPNYAMKTLPPFPKPPEDHRFQDARRRIKRAYVIDIALKVLELRHYGISEDMKLEALEVNRLNNRIHKAHNKGLLKILEFFGTPEDIYEQYMYEFDKEKRERERIQKEEQAQQEMEAKSNRQQAIKGRRFSIDSSSDSLNRDSNSQASDMSSEPSDMHFHKPPLPQKKVMRESKSEFSLMNKPKEVKGKGTPQRKIQTRQKQSRAKITPQNKPKQHKVFDMYE